MDYIFRVTNEGNCEADFALSVSQSADWDTSFGSTFATIPHGGHTTSRSTWTFPRPRVAGRRTQGHSSARSARSSTRTTGLRRLSASAIRRSRASRPGCEADQPVLRLGGYQTVSLRRSDRSLDRACPAEEHRPGQGRGRRRRDAPRSRVAPDLVDATCAYPDLDPGRVELRSRLVHLRSAELPGRELQRLVRCDVRRHLRDRVPGPPRSDVRQAG